MSEFENLKELHEIIVNLEKSNNFREAEVLHQNFLKFAQKQTKHPYDLGKAYFVVEGDKGLKIAQRFLDQQLYMGDKYSVWERIQSANPKPGKKPSFLGISLPESFELPPPGSPLKYPKPTQEERIAYLEFIKRNPPLPGIKK